MSRKKDSSNLRFAAVFFVLVLGTILISLIFRATFILRESKFDGTSNFSLQIKSNKNQIISFSPKSSTIGILNLENISASSLEIPIDASIYSDLSLSKENVDRSLFRMIFDFKNQKELNSVGIFRLFIFTKTIKDSAINEKEINEKTDKLKTDSIISTMFVDPQILDDKQSIEVVNSTNTYGLGNRLANLISNMGGNVILVSTGDEKKESEIQYSKYSYTVEKLSSVLKFKKVKMKKNSLADVIIILGQDNAKTTQF